jgi:putative aminopeptidase FrvX
MLAESAVAQGITVQRSATAGRSGTDTDAIFLRNGGIPCGLVSLPIRYMHTTVELCALKDLEQIGQVFAGAALAMTGHESLQAIGTA